MEMIMKRSKGYKTGHETTIKVRKLGDKWGWRFVIVLPDGEQNDVDAGYAPTREEAATARQKYEDSARK